MTTTMTMTPAIARTPADTTRVTCYVDRADAVTLKKAARALGFRFSAYVSEILRQAAAKARDAVEQKGA